MNDNDMRERMNQEVYDQIHEEMVEERKTLDQIEKLMYRIPKEELFRNLEQVEATLEFFCLKVEFYFRNDSYDVLNMLDILLDKARKWSDINNNEDNSVFLEKYFLEIRRILDEIIRRTEGYPKNNDKMGLVLIAKNEAKYLPEWIEYHRVVGITRFFIYDNGSTDNTKDVLQQYIDEGIVTYTWCPGRMRQYPAYADALDRFRFEVKYMGFIDTDEFILPVQGNDVPEIVEQFLEEDPFAGGIGVSWRIFGSNGVIEDNDGTVIGTFLRRADNAFERHRYIKTICNPRRTLYPLSPYHFLFMDDIYMINEKKDRVEGEYDLTGSEQECKYLQINHYFVKSREYWDNVKIKRGFADSADSYKNNDFEVNDRNEVLDKRMLKYVHIVEQNLRKRGFE